MLRIFTSVKIQRLRPSLNPQTWMPEASMLTTRPPKPSCWSVSFGVMFIFVRVPVGLGLSVFFSLLEMQLGYLLGSGIFFWFLIISFIIFLLFLVFSSFLYWFSCWFQSDSARKLSHSLHETYQLPSVQ